MAPAVFQHTLPNGLTLLAERMDHVRSATVYFQVPGGCVFDPEAAPGLAGVLAEMLTRGAGDRDTEAFALALDNLGVDRGESIGLMNMGFSGGTLARNVAAALPLFADMLRRPQLPADDLDAAKALALQDIQGLEDSPQELVMIELKKRYFPAPLNRDRSGTAAGIEAVTPELLAAHHARQFRPNGTIMSVAGNIDWDALKGQVEELFGDWKRGPETPVVPEASAPQSTHIQKDTQQTQIALAFPSVTMTDPEYFAARGAVGVLSAGMSSRLFTEVREKRGLCYSVYASHETMKDRGTVLGYSGTRAERAQETLDVMLAEMKKLAEGIDDDELDRVKAGLKTSLIMQQESTSSRAGSLARDWYYLGRVRSFDEIRAEIDGLTTAAILKHLARLPLADPTIVTLGPAPLAAAN